MPTPPQEDLSHYNAEGTLLRQAQRAMLSILIEIDRICRRHQIPYWLDSGTLIGAVRHGGFIPWDDDIDICVLRSDYPRLRQALIAELPPRYQLSDSQTDRYSYRNIGQVKDTYTYCDFPLARKQQSQGLWVDILLQIPATSTRYKASVEKIYGRVFREIHHLSESQGKPRWVCYIKRTIAYCLCPFIYPLTYFGDRYAAAHDDGTLMHTWGECANSRRYKKDIFPLAELSFEGYAFLVPHDYDAYLRHIYGDYMTLPAPEQRQTHLNVESLRFADHPISRKDI